MHTTASLKGFLEFLDSAHAKNQINPKMVFKYSFIFPLSLLQKAYITTAMYKFYSFEREKSNFAFLA